MNFENYTTKSQQAVLQAQRHAEEFNHQEIEPAHLLKGMMGVDDNVFSFLVKKLNINRVFFDQKLEETDETGCGASGPAKCWKIDLI